MAAKISIVNVAGKDASQLKIEIQGRTPEGRFVEKRELTLDPDEGTVVEIDAQTSIQLIEIPTKPPVN